MCHSVVPARGVNWARRPGSQTNVGEVVDALRRLGAPSNARPSRMRWTHLRQTAASSSSTCISSDPRMSFSSATSVGFSQRRARARDRSNVREPVRRQKVVTKAQAEVDAELLGMLSSAPGGDLSIGAAVDGIVRTLHREWASAYYYIGRSKVVETTASAVSAELHCGGSQEQRSEIRHQRWPENPIKGPSAKVRWLRLWHSNIRLSRYTAVGPGLLHEHDFNSRRRRFLTVTETVTGRPRLAPVLASGRTWPPAKCAQGNCVPSQGRRRSLLPSIGSRPAVHAGSSASFRTSAHGCRGLFERASVQLAAADPPPAGLEPPDLAGLDLDDQDPAIRVADDDVGFAFAHVAAVARDPSDVVQQRHVRWRDRPKPLDDESFSGRACRSGRHQ